MTITEVCIAAQAEGLSYGQYVSKYLTRQIRVNRLDPELKPAKAGLKRDQVCRQYTLDGEFVAEYETVIQAAEAVNAKVSTVLRALNGDNATCSGYQWRYGHDATPVRKKKVVCQYTPEGKLVGVYRSGLEAGNVYHANINRALKNGTPICGYYWRREYRD